MKKLVTKLLCGVLMSSVMLCGCNQAAETTASSETESQTEATTTMAETEPVQTTVDDRPEINVDNMMKVTELYNSKQPDGTHAETVKTDSIRGSAMYHVTDGAVHFGYYSEGGSSISASVMSGKRTMDVTLSLVFKDMKTNILLTGQTSLDGMESFIDSVIANDKEKFYIYNDLTLDAYAEQVKKDLPILYSRFIAYADQAFPELGLKFEDLGVRLGSKYREVDHTQNTSMERTVANPLAYKNGVSSNNKKVWTEFYYNAVGKLGGMTGKGWHSAYGERSASMLTPSDYVQYSATNKKYGEMLYHKMTADAKEPAESFWIYVNNTSTKKKKKISVAMRYELEQKEISLGKGIITYKYMYFVTISAAPGQYNKVFASKESLKKYVKVTLLLSNKKGKITTLSEKKAFTSKIKKSFEADGCKYYSKDDLVDILWDHHENFLASLDHGLSGMGTSLSDIGVNWKKSA